MAFLDISGFKELMKNERALKALDRLYSSGYNVLRNQNDKDNVRIEGFFMSDCGILKISENKLAQCKECKFYKPIDEAKGDCFGHEVPATLNSDKCPTNSFQPRN